MARYARALAGAGAAAALGAVAWWGDTTGLAIVVGAVMLALAVGWPALAQIPSPVSAAAVLAIAGGASIALALGLGTRGGVGVLAAVLGIGIAVAFAREAARPAPRPSLVASLGAVVAGMVGQVLLAVWLWVVPLATGPEVTVVACAALAGGVLASMVPWEGWRGGATIAVVATGCGGAAAAVVGSLAVPAGLGLGLAVGLLTGFAHVTFDRLVAARRASAWIGAAVVPLALAALVAYAAAVWLS